MKKLSWLQIDLMLSSTESDLINIQTVEVVLFIAVCNGGRMPLGLARVRPRVD